MSDWGGKWERSDVGGSPMSELAEKFGRWRLNLADEEEDDYRE